MEYAKLRAACGMGGGRRMVRRRRGGDFLGIGNFFRNTVPAAARSVYNNAIVPAHDWIKKNKIVSRGLSLIPHPVGKAASIAASIGGYGRRRRRVVRRRGRGIGSTILSGVRKVGAFVKKHRLLSTAVGALVPGPGKFVALPLRMAGYGRRRRVVRRRGGAFNLLGNPGRPFWGGRRRRVVRRRRGGDDSAFHRAIVVKEPAKKASILSRIHKFIKGTKVISSGLAHFGYPKLSAAAAALGYGRRRKRRVVRRRVVRRRRVGGRNYADALAPIARHSFRSLARRAYTYAKKEKLISRGLSYLGHSKLSAAAAALGFGRRRKRVVRRRRRGGDFGSEVNARRTTTSGNILGAVHRFVKKHRVASRSLGALGFTKLSKIAHTFGYGRRRRRVVRRRR